MKIIFFGDVVGKIARTAIKQILPELKNEFAPDLIIANIENAAHGTGITEKTLKELRDAGVNCFTSGDHIFDKPEAGELINQNKYDLIRPANYADSEPGKGYKVIEVGTRKVMIINLVGNVFMKKQAESPFTTIDKIVKEGRRKKVDIFIVDLHAEATSEKIAFGWHVDGQISAVLGTHTHIPTADEKILPNGTAYITDVGMVGARNSVLGMTKEISIQRFLNNEVKLERIPKSGIVDIGAVFIEIDPNTGKAISIKRLDKTVEVM